MKRVFAGVPCGSLILAISLLSCRSTGNSSSTGLQPSLREYEQRLTGLRAQIPAIISSAEAAANTFFAHPDASLHVPGGWQKGFGDELVSRAGGLSQAFPPVGPKREQTNSNDIVLCSARSWDNDRTNVVSRLQEYRAKGWRTILFASAAGRPADLGADFFIDNSATSGDAAHGHINALANVTLGWMWCCEYVTAMTRKGKMPGVLISVVLDEAADHNRQLQSREGRHWFGECSTPIPAGRLSELYLARVEKLVADLKSPGIQGQVRTAADIVAQRMTAGKPVAIAGMGHLIVTEALETGLVAPWKPFRALSRPATAFKENLAAGDLLVWIGYIGINSKHMSFTQYIDEARPDVITCYAPLSDAYGTVSNVVAHIDQSWTMGDAEVPLPCPPGRMAPVSGLNAALLLRMLDDEVAERLRMRTW